jgi:uncharacterized protein (TIGR02271 family)
MQDPSYPVITKDGVRGTLAHPMREAEDTSHVLVQLEDGRQVLVPREALVLQAEGRYYYLAASVGELSRASLEVGGSAGTITLPVVAEELDIQRRRYETGRVRITKRVHEREETVDEPLISEQVDVRRVPIDRVVEHELAPRTEGDTLIIPVLEEMLVVTKQLVLREELHITMRRTEIHKPQQVTLRREELVVEQIETGDTARGDVVP